MSIRENPVCSCGLPDRNGPSPSVDAHLAASVSGFVGQDVLLDLSSGRLPGDQGTLSGDLAGRQVCRRVQYCKEEKMLGAPARLIPGTCIRLPTCVVSGLLTC